ncbi:MAG: transcriptional regulator [Thaumarchaeota archaeon]|nr:transcriptional regulator [Nitrososphaerota archaeon]
MPSYRTQLRIIADVLKTARDKHQAEGISINVLLRGGNMPYVRLKALIANLIQHNLLEEMVHEKGKRYRISLKGYEFLQTYSRFEEFTRSFGLEL